MITNDQTHDAITMTATISDQFYALWDVDGQWYLWIVFLLSDGTSIVEKYLA